jgi:hypothetical protein
VVENSPAFQETYPSLRLVVDTVNYQEKWILIVLNREPNTRDLAVFERVSPKTIQIKLVDADTLTKRWDLSSERRLLLSRSQDKVYITMYGGYSYTGKVNLQRGGNIDLEHVKDPEDAKTKHDERTAGNNLDPLTVEEALKIYEAILDGVLSC